MKRGEKDSCVGGKRREGQQRGHEDIDSCKTKRRKGKKKESVEVGQVRRREWKYI